MRDRRFSIDRDRFRQNFLPVLTALIWGTAFPMQSMGANYLSAFTFNAARSIPAFIFLLMLCLVRRKVQYGSMGSLFRRGAGEWKKLLAAGGICGTVLGVSTFFQQRGLETTSSGKAAFITALYIVIVPLAERILGRRTPGQIWFSVCLAVGGLYFLCVRDEFSFAPGDLDILICAFCFSVQILTVDYFSTRLDGVELSCMQFLVMTLFSLCGGMVSGESVTWEAVRAALVPILYCGIFSSGIAYTLQIIAQKGANPAVVSLLMSTESVFGVLAGAVILREHLSGREYLGCVLMFTAVICAQIPRREGVPEKSPA